MLLERFLPTLQDQTKQPNSSSKLKNQPETSPNQNRPPIGVPHFYNKNQPQKLVPPRALTSLVHVAKTIVKKLSKIQDPNTSTEFFSMICRAARFGCRLGGVRRRSKLGRCILLACEVGQHRIFQILCPNQLGRLSQKRRTQVDSVTHARVISSGNCGF